MILNESTHLSIAEILESALDRINNGLVGGRIRDIQHAAAATTVDGPAITKAKQNMRAEQLKQVSSEPKVIYKKG